jgi:hypothetical protein
MIGSPLSILLRLENAPGGPDPEATVNPGGDASVPTLYLAGPTWLRVGVGRLEGGALRLELTQTLNFAAPNAVRVGVGRWDAASR